jgi:cytochrome c oxidase subunit 3/cytochrome o ubiquinol oxidase subunit 3
LSSSVTVHLADRALRRGGTSHAEESRVAPFVPGHSLTPWSFLLWWSATIILGILFLAGTAYEWIHLIREYGLTISRNLFGTTFYTLVGFHALHVSVGVLVMLTVLGLTLSRRQAIERAGVELVSWYWHFVDGVWIVVFMVVYVVGR